MASSSTPCDDWAFSKLAQYISKAIRVASFAESSQLANLLQLYTSILSRRFETYGQLADEEDEGEQYNICIRPP